MAYRYYALVCDACEAVIGMNSDPSHPVRGITICSDVYCYPRGHHSFGCADR